MKITPTKQQKDIIKLAKENNLLKVSAGSGCAKSSTLKLIADEIKEPSLYLAFNKSMADEAKGKFPSHVDCMTTHSLAYRKIGVKYSHKLTRPKGKYVNVAGTGGEIASFFKIPDFTVSTDPEGSEIFIPKAFIGLIIRDTVNSFEHSDEDTISKDNIPHRHLKDIKSRYEEVNVRKFTRMIVRFAKCLWEERTDTLSEVLATHDTYLKLFQLKKLKLQGYSVIYLDESQDSNDCVLDIFLNQKDHAKLVLVGDGYQQIYQWRGSINAMDKVVATEGILTKSFRFGQEIADIANHILDEEFTLQGFEEIQSKVGCEDEVVDYSKPYTILYRTNMNLLFDALDLLDRGESVNVNFDTSDFTKMILSAKELYSGNLRGVKHEEIIPYESWTSFTEEAKQNPEFNRIVNIVESGDDERVIDTLHRYKAKGDEKITLITSHRAKGLEWDQVILSDDFPSVYSKEGKYIGLSEPERNLLYVASTRAKRALKYNSTVQDIIDYKDSVIKRKCLKMEVTSFSDYELNLIDNPLPTPKGLHAKDAVDRGIDEYFEHKDFNGMTQYEYDSGSQSLETVDIELLMSLKDLK